MDLTMKVVNMLRTMMTYKFTPAHKVVGDAHKPGQTVSERKEETTLGDYIHRKTRNEAFQAVAAERKISFDEWLHHRFPAGVDGYAHILNVNDLKQCWQAAQENK